MGCSTSNSVIHPQSMQDTLYGVLRVHFVGGLIERQLNSPNSQLTAICRMSNQEFKSKTWTKASFNNIDEAYEFMVNSRYQKYGRSLQIQLNESGLFSQSIVGVGLADLQLIIRERKKESFKIYLTNEKSKVGWIQLEVLFQQFPTFPITLLFDSVLVRRKPTTLGDLCCRIRTTIGQQVLVSTISQDKQDQPPNWRNEKFTFHILKGIIREGKIQVLHNDKQIGALSLNIEQIEQSSQFQIRISEQFYYGGNIIAGTIKFFISKGDDINSVALQMKKSAFISPSKKKLPPLNANFKSNELFKIQLSKNNPKIAQEDKIIVQNQLQNEFENHSLDSNKQQVKIQSKFQDNLINKNPTIFDGQRKNKDTEEEESKRKEEALQKERQIKQEAFERKLRQQQQSRQRQIKQQKQRQQRQTQFRISELKRIHKQQEDKRLQQLQEQRMRQLETIKLIEQERRKKLQQEQDRLKQLEQEKRLKEIEEQARKQEQKRKKLQEELRKLQQLQAQRLLQQEKKKKKIEEQQAQQKRRKQQQQQQYRKKQQLKIIQQKRKAEQLKRLKEEQQIRLKRVQEQSIETKQVFKKIQKQQVENNNQIKGGEQIKINLDQQFQRQKLQKSVIQGRKLIEQVKSKQSFQKGEQIVKQFKKIHDEQNIIKQDENIFYQKPQSKLEVIQNIPRLYIQSQIQTNNLKRSHNQFSNSKQIKGSQTDKIPITQQMKVNTKNQYDKFSTTDKLKHIELSGPSIDQTSNIIPTTNKSQQIVLPSQRQHSRLLLESALLENESDNEQDK